MSRPGLGGWQPTAVVLILGGLLFGLPFIAHSSTLENWAYAGGALTAFAPVISWVFSRYDQAKLLRQQQSLGAERVALTDFIRTLMRQYGVSGAQQRVSNLAANSIDTVLEREEVPSWEFVIGLLGQIKVKPSWRRKKFARDLRLLWEAAAQPERSHSAHKRNKRAFTRAGLSTGLLLIGLLAGYVVRSAFAGNTSSSSSSSSSKNFAGIAPRTIWSFYVGAAALKAPPIVADRTLFLGDDKGTAYAYDMATGAVQWAIPTIGAFREVAPVSGDGTAYFGSVDGTVYAINVTTGKILWHRPTRGYIASPLSLAAGTVYVSSGSKMVALYASTGLTRWSDSTSLAIQSNPPVANANLYIGNVDGTVYAIYTATGKIHWTQFISDGIESSPILANGTLYLGNAEGTVYAIDAATGKIHWHLSTSGGIQSSPILANGTLYLGNAEGTVYAIDAATGKIHWTRPTHDTIESSPILADGMLYVGSDEDRVYAINPLTGKIHWTQITSDAVVSSPTFANGIVYVDDLSGTVYALNAATGVIIWKFRAPRKEAFTFSPIVAHGIVCVVNRDGWVYGLQQR